MREYTLHPLADDNDDATKLRTAIASTSRNWNVSKPYDRKLPTQPSQGYGGFAGRQDYLFRRKVRPKENSATIFAPGSCFLSHLPGDFAKHCPCKATSSQQWTQRQQLQPPNSANVGQASRQ